MHITFYWFAYFLTFVIGYIFLLWVRKQKFLFKFTKLKKALEQDLDWLALAVLLGVILGGRVGYFVPFGLKRWLEHWQEFFKVWEGWMAFVGGVLGVTVMILIWWRIRWLDLKDLLVLGDLIVLIVPLGILLGRIGNFLNQEIAGIEVAQLPSGVAKVLGKFGLTVVYTWFWDVPRVNINFLEAAWEGLLVGVILWLVFWKIRQKNPKPWVLVGVFLVSYGLIRFLLEFWKFYPHGWEGLSLAQLWMIVFVLAWGGLLAWSLFWVRFKKNGN